MILEGNQRGGAKNLALHLLKEENDHVEVHEVRGFVSEDLVSALNEAYAVSRGTRAKKFLFSLSLNPPDTENVSTEVFKATIERVEDEMGLSGQPRAIVFHEKNARRHCHVAWSRIDAKEMKAIPLPYTKYKLMDISRELYLENGWKMPKGFIRSAERDPHNFTLAEWQQAKRIGKKPKAIKTTISDCWAASDTQAAFANALQEQGYVLARGTRRDFVVIDQHCEVYGVARSVGIRVKEVRTKLIDQDKLPEIEKAKLKIAEDMVVKLSKLHEKHENAVNMRLVSLNEELQLLVKRHKQERVRLRKTQKSRRIRETKERQKRYNKGLRGLLDRVTGKHRQIKKQNERETDLANKRDEQEKDAMIFSQMAPCRAIKHRQKRLEEFSKGKQRDFFADLSQYEEIRHGKKGNFEHGNFSARRKPSLER